MACCVGMFASSVYVQEKVKRCEVVGIDSCVQDLCMQRLGAMLCLQSMRCCW
jgi:5,10-methylene-tetrahydrofolate dehydrogenase/methenyl tetrahydrofolate cyclohydrolase